jgi:cellobiose-specific phosphotransferase system component IIB
MENKIESLTKRLLKLYITNGIDDNLVDKFVESLEESKDGGDIAYLSKLVGSLERGIKKDIDESIRRISEDYSVEENLAADVVILVGMLTAYSDSEEDLAEVLEEMSKKFKVIKVEDYFMTNILYSREKENRSKKKYHATVFVQKEGEDDIFGFSFNLAGLYLAFSMNNKDDVSGVRYYNIDKSDLSEANETLRIRKIQQALYDVVIRVLSL